MGGERGLLQRVVPERARDLRQSPRASARSIGAPLERLDQRDARPLEERWRVAGSWSVAREHVERLPVHRGDSSSRRTIAARAPFGLAQAIAMDGHREPRRLDAPVLLRALVHQLFEDRRRLAPRPRPGCRARASRSRTGRVESFERCSARRISSARSNWFSLFS